MSSVLLRLANWYLSQCDGKWEHDWGLSITTLDNPGFSLKINLHGTSLERADFDRVVVDYDTNDRWYTCWKENAEFHAAGAPSRIEEMIECFLRWNAVQTQSD